MYAMIPVYYPSLEEASRNNEAALWCDSYNINMNCVNYIQDRAMTAYNTRELDEFIEDLVAAYGVERAMYVLSRTVQFREWDERFGMIARDRAKTYHYPDTLEKRDENYVDPTSRYVMELDPCVINAILVGLIEYEQHQERINAIENSIYEPEDITAEL